jgi:hypothetical protein
MVASRGLFSDNGCVSVASRVVEGRSICCVPRSVFRFNHCVPVAPRAPGMNMEPVKFDKAIRSKRKGKISLTSRPSSFISKIFLLKICNEGFVLTKLFNVT